MPRIPMEQVRDAARALQGAREYQYELPATEEAPDVSWLTKLPWEWLEGPAGIVIRAVGWTLLAVTTGLLLYWLWRMLDGYSHNERVSNITSGASIISPDVARHALSQAESLAGEGRFAEAIHALLLITFDDLIRRSRQPLPKSLTSREVLEGVRLPSPAKEELSHLVLESELCHFGGQRARSADYERCVAHYRTFLEALA